jgi:hypothetical protein
MMWHILEFERFFDRTMGMVTHYGPAKEARALGGKYALSACMGQALRVMAHDF